MNSALRPPEPFISFVAPLLSSANFLLGSVDRKQPESCNTYFSSIGTQSTETFSVTGSMAIESIEEISGMTTPTLATITFSIVCTLCTLHKTECSAQFNQ
jgi:hypothetical protein